MEIIIDLKTLHEAANSWNPPFKYVDDLDECSDLINKPHEDYPDFVSSTKESIEIMIEDLRQNLSVSEYNIKSIHGFCFKEKNIISGRYRMTNVRVGDNLIPCQPYLISPFMMSILPIKVGMGEDALQQWYKIFETIHPFEDGNGRIGGIILASISFLETGKYMISRA